MASGDTLLVFTALHNEPPTSAFATPDTRNDHPVLDFNDSATSTSLFTGVLPRAYSGGGVTVGIGYSMTSALSGTVSWQSSFERIGDQQQDLDSDGFAGFNTSSATVVPATSGLVDVADIAFTDGADMDSVAVGEQFRFKIERNVVADSAVGDAELNYIELRET